MSDKKLKEKNPDRLPMGTFLAFRMGFFSLAGNFIVIGFLMIYCTNMLGMPSSLVGSLLLASKILDAFAELYSGYLVDRTRTKLGKGRPWDLCLIGVWVCTILLFATPAGASMTLKAVWVFLFYTLVQTVFQTLVQCATTPYLIRAFRNRNVIVKVQSYGGVVGMVLSIALSIGLPMLVKSMATTPGGWLKVIVIVSIPCLLLGLTRFIFVKEQYNLDLDASEEKVSIKDILKTFASNKYVWMVAGIGFSIQLISAMNATTYYFTYIVGDLAKMGVLQSISIMLLPVMFFFPALIKKFSVSTMIAAGCVSAVFGSILAFFAGGNIPFLITAFMFIGIGMLAPPYLQAVMIFDCVKYNTLCGKRSSEASMAALNQFLSNVGQGLGGWVLGVVLSAGGFVSASAGEIVTQPDSALFTIRLLFSLIPGAVYVIMFIFARLYTLEKKLPQMEKESEERNAAETGNPQEA